MRVRLWCKTCGENLKVNEDMRFSSMYDEETGVFELDTSGMMCGCPIEEDEPDWREEV